MHKGAQLGQFQKVILETIHPPFIQRSHHFVSNCMSVCAVLTDSEHCLITLVSSCTTMSTHLREGSVSFMICLVTMTSKALSGVNSPTLSGHVEGKHQSQEER